MADDTKAQVPTRTTTTPRSFTEQLIEPLSRLRGEVDRLFEDFPARWPAFQMDRLVPRMPVPAMEMTETEDAFKLTVEVPGIEAKEIDVSVEEDMLVVSGEKKEEREEKERDYYRSERSYGSFERRIALPPTADADRIKARASNGVLHITLPKSEKAQQNKRRIAIEAGE